MNSRNDHALLGRKAATATAWLLGLLTSIFAAELAAQEHGYLFTRIADQRTLIQEGDRPPQAFFGLSTPQIEGNRVGFIGQWAFRPPGVYVWEDGELVKVFGEETDIPGTAAKAQSLLDFDLQADAVAVSALTPNTILVVRPGSIEVVADTSTPIPGTTDVFRVFGDVAFAGQRVIFAGGLHTIGARVQQGVYLSDQGALTVLADRVTTIPGTSGTFRWFTYVDGTAEGWTFSQAPASGQGRDLAIFRGPDGGLETVANRSTEVPVLGGKFAAFDGLSMSPSAIAFTGVLANGQLGAFASQLGALRMVAGPGTLVPGEAGQRFTSTGNISLDGSSSLFSGFWFPAGNGIFAELDGQLVSVVKRGDLLDGERVLSVDVGPDALSNGKIAFRATLSGGGTALYLARPAQANECVPTTEALCLESRFRITTRWRRPDGTSGKGSAVALGPASPLQSTSGFFYFFRPDNVELVVKLLNSCQSTGHFWVFAGGLTNVEVTLEVEDKKTGFRRTYTNPGGIPYQPLQDTTAFATCP